MYCFYDKMQQYPATQLILVRCHIGSGKTRIAVELAGLLLQKKPAAKVVFLATTVALAQQQAGKLLLCRSLDCDELQLIWWMNNMLVVLCCVSARLVDRQHAAYSQYFASMFMYMPSCLTRESAQTGSVWTELKHN